MKPDEFFGSVADDVKPLDLETTCTSPNCNNHRAHGYLMCWDCRDRLDLKTEGTRPPKREAPSVTPPREQHPWNAKDVHRLRMNAHLGAKRAAQVLKRTESSVRNMANLAKPKISLRQRDPQKNEYLQAQIAKDTAEAKTTIVTASEVTEMATHAHTDVPEATLEDAVSADGTNRSATEIVADMREHYIEGGIIWDSCMAITIEDNARAAAREANDEHDRIVERIDAYSMPSEEILSVRDHRQTPTLILETIDVRLRLLCATVESESARVPASVRCSIEDNIERVRELVKALAS